MDTMEHANERFKRTELAIEQSQEMVAENVARRARLSTQRCLVEATHSLVEINPAIRNERLRTG
jgi:hypothetical protein